MLNEAQQQLVTDNIKFAYYLANGWCNKQGVFDREELTSIVLEEFCKAADSFDPNRGCSFIRYAKHYVQHALINKIRDEISHRKIEDKANQLAANAILDDAHVAPENNAANMDLHDALDQLSEQHRAIIHDFYFNGISRKETALKHGITDNQLKFILSGIRQQLREKIA